MDVKELIKLSHHSVERFYERYGIERVEVCRSTAERAWRNGRTADCFGRKMKKHLKRIETRYNDHTLLKIHSKNCYVFERDGTLKTVYSLKHYDEYVNDLKPYKERDIDSAA